MSEVRTIEYAKGLSSLIKVQTVSAISKDNGAFKTFHKLLEKTFPNLFSVAEVKSFNGSLLLKVKGLGGDKPVMFMNHSDVVEGVGKWKYGAFSGAIEEGKVWGRGVLDTKGGLYCMLQACEELIKSGFTPKSDIYLESSIDEETDGNGAREIREYLLEKGVKFDYVLDEGGMIVAEPIYGAKGEFAMVGVGEKGMLTLNFIARSKGGHGATPFKNSPLVRLGKFMAKVDGKNLFKFKMSPAFIKMFKEFSKTMKGPIRFVLAHPKLFAPILKREIPKMSNLAGAMTKTTIAFTMAQGAACDNVIPERAMVTGDVRVSHHQGVEESLKILTRLAKKYDIEVERLSVSEQSGLSDYTAEQFKGIEGVINQLFPNVRICPYVMTGASDCRFMSKLSENCYRFTPFKVTDKQVGSIHGVDENVNVSCLVPAVDFYKKLMQKI